MIERTIAPAVLLGAQTYPVVTITGPRQSGKTTLAKTLFPHYGYVNLEELEARRFAMDDPAGFIRSNPPPLILDEIQNCPGFLSQIQVECDRTGIPGMFVLTGSQQLGLMGAVSQSLAGRSAIFTLLPFSIEELLSTVPDLSRDEWIFRGGLPRIYQAGIDPAVYCRDYLRTYVERDIRAVLNVKNLIKFEIFLTMMAGRVGQLLNLSAMSADVGVSSTTLAEWVSVLEACNIIFRLPPWHGNIGKRLTKTPKLYFTDTALACSLLRIESPAQLSRDPLRGNLFENLVVVEALKARLNANRAPNLYFFRTDRGMEVDLLQAVGRELIPWEVKSAESTTREFFDNLEALKRLVPGTVDSPLPPGGLIYAGEGISSLRGWNCANFKETGKLFTGTYD